MFTLHTVKDSSNTVLERTGLLGNAPCTKLGAWWFHDGTLLIMMTLHCLHGSVTPQWWNSRKQLLKCVECYQQLHLHAWVHDVKLLMMMTCRSTATTICEERFAARYGSTVLQQWRSTLGVCLIMPQCHSSFTMSMQVMFVAKVVADVPFHWTNLGLMSRSCEESHALHSLPMRICFSPPFPFSIFFNLWTPGPKLLKHNDNAASLEGMACDHKWGSQNSEFFK